MNAQNEIVIYQPENSEIRVEVQTDGDTVWLNRQQLSVLFARDIKTIGKHINNALNDELAGYPVVAKFATTAADGKIYQTEHYNLDVAISIGYRVKSPEGIRFRRWATAVLKQHLLKGYTINESRLAQLHQVLRIISRSAVPEIAGISEVLGFFSNGLDLLDEYDHQTLKKPRCAPMWTGRPRPQKENGEKT